jgi:hypothetical protein
LKHCLDASLDEYGFIANWHDNAYGWQLRYSLLGKGGYCGPSSAVKRFAIVPSQGV